MPTDISRRTLLTSSSFATAGLVIAPALTAAPAQTSPASAAGRAASKYEIRPLTFDPKNIKGLSEKILVSHYENNYAGAVKRLNAITEQLASLDFDKAPTFTVNGLKREELIAANSMILHEVYFSSIGEPNQPGKALADAIARDFGSMEHWRSEFIGTGKALGGGSGWVILAYSPRDKRLLNTWAADHTTNLAGGEPLLALDMYEHAYHMDFGAKAGDYVSAFMNTINWSAADKVYGQRRG